MTILLTSPGMTGARAEPIDDRKLHAFLAAAHAVDKVMDDWRPRLASADTAIEVDSLRRRANSEIMATIENAEGITLAEYRTIRSAVVSDPEILERIMRLMRQHQALR